MEKFFRLVHKYKGQHYFKVDGFEKVTKVTVGNAAKVGRPYCVGITLINYNSYVGGYAHFSDHKDNVFVEISREEFYAAFEMILKKIR